MSIKRQNKFPVISNLDSELDSIVKSTNSELEDIHKDGYLKAAKGIKIDNTPPVADGVYTVGKGTTTDGKITVKGGIITSIQQAV